MATSSTYYLNGPTLGTATAVFSNSGLTVCAPNGFYSDGIIVREQVGCVLLPRQVCPSCGNACGGLINLSGSQGVYYLNIDLGSGTGAVIVRFNPINIPDGISVLYDSVIYNGLSSPIFGWLQGTAGLATYIGATGSDCGIVAGSPYTLNEFEYNGSTFTPLGTTTSVSVVSGQMELTASGPGNSVMVIPKVASTPNVIDLTIIGPCTSTAFEVSISCPAPLTSFDSSAVTASDLLACDATVNQTYYVAHVNGAAGTLGLYDLVFSDSIGQFKLTAGYYKTTDAGTNNWYQVDVNGVIIAFGVCPSPIESYNCVSGVCVDPGDGSGTYATLGECEGACGINVISVGGFMEPCSGGAIDDYMGAIVVLDIPADVDTEFGVEVFYVETGSTCGGTTFSQSFTVSILAGDDISNFNACTEGTNFPTGAVICGACISSCDNPNITIGAFDCPL